DEVRRRRHADDVRDLLGDGGRRRGLARRRRIAPRRACLRGAAVVRPGDDAAAAAAARDRMNALRRFGAFWWEFVVGDDWRIAVGVVVALAACAAVAASGAPAWWIVPL